MVDSLKTLICPACGKEMKKIYVMEVDKVVDICSEGCGGIFFDNKELKFFDEEHESIDKINEFLEGKIFTPVNQYEVRVCPVCNVPMVKNCTSGLEAVQIDECYTCGGKFLDYGELEKLRAEFSTEEQSNVHILNKIENNFGALLNDDEELKRLKMSRSPLKKFYDSIFGLG